MTVRSGPGARGSFLSHNEIDVVISNTPIVLNELVRNSLSQNYEVLPASVLRWEKRPAVCHNGTPYLHNNLENVGSRRSCVSWVRTAWGWTGTASRSYRKTWLRGKRCQEDINNYWMGHQPETMSELYSRLDEDLKTLSGN